MMWGMGFGGWGMLLGGVFWLLLIVVVVWALVGRTGQDARPSRMHDDPMETLKARYARGEISREQYEQMRRDILG